MSRYKWLSLVADLSVLSSTVSVLDVLVLVGASTWCSLMGDQVTSARVWRSVW